MSGRSKWLWAAVTLLVLPRAGQAGQVVLGFDDIPVPLPAQGEFVPSGYGGFNWGADASNSSLFFVENDADYEKVPGSPTDTGYANTYGAPSAPNAVANNTGLASTSISRSAPFDFVGASFASFGGYDVFQSTSAQTLTITGSRLGNTVGSMTIALDAAGYHFVNVGFDHIDTITFTAGGGNSTIPDPTDPTKFLPGGFFLMDNLTYAPELAGDADDDGKVDFTDLVTLARNYGKAGTWATGDFNADGTVGFDDLVILARNYGQTIGASAGAALVGAVVPEPTGALALCGAAMAMLLPRRRSF